MTSDLQSEAVKRFWQWFAANAERLRVLYSTSQFECLAVEMNHELDRVEPQLAREM